MSVNEQTAPARKSRLTSFSSDSPQQAEIISDTTLETAFPMSSLPLEVQDMISEVARVSFANPNLVAVQSLGWMAAALGKGVTSIMGAMRTFPNLFILGIAETGSGKSESAKHLSCPLNELIREEIRFWNSDTKPKAETRLREIKLMQAEIDKAAKENGGEYFETNRRKMEELSREQRQSEAQLKPPRLIAEDATQEALADALRSFDESLMLYSSDAGKAISNLLGRYTSTSGGGILREDTLLLKGYSVEATVIDRVNRSITLTAPCLTMLWMVQPGKIPLLFGDKGLCDGGFMPRMMPCMVPSGLPERNPQEQIQSEISQDWRRLICELFQLRKSGGGAQNTHCRVEFTISEEAMNAWHEWDNANRRETKAGKFVEISGFVSRWGEWAQRIAVVLQAVKHVKDRSNLTISLETMVAAMEVAKWFINEQLRILHGARRASDETDMQKKIQRMEKLESALKSSGNERSLSDLERRNGFSGKEARELVKMFPEKFEIREKQTSTKPSVVCVLK